MGKKTVVWAYLIILSLGTILSLYIPKNEVAANNEVVIPGQAIRLRILANSDLSSDQALKRKVRDKVNEKISVWVKDLTSIKKARKVIQAKLPEIQTTAEQVVKENGSEQAVKVDFGKVQFPTKLYGQFLYPAGDYEAVLITLGEGKGANWWCVLFPPLCFLDFSNGVAVSKGFDGEQTGKDQASSKGIDGEQSGKGQASSKEFDGKQSGKGQIEGQGTEIREKQEHTAVSNQAGNANPAAVGDHRPEIANTGSAAPKLAGSSQQESVTSSGKSTIGKINKPDPIQSKPQQETVSRTERTNANKTNKPIQSEPSAKKQAPVYTAEDEQAVKVKFFAVELWNKIF